MIKGLIQEENIILININAPKTGTPKCITQILMDLKEESESNTIIVNDFNNSPCQWIDHLDRKSIRKHQPQMTNKDRLTIDLYTTSHLKAREYTFF